MMNPIKPIPCEILEVKKETELEWTFKVKTDVVPNHGQFMQLSIPKVGEAPISISAFGQIQYFCRCKMRHSCIKYRKSNESISF